MFSLPFALHVHRIFLSFSCSTLLNKSFNNVMVAQVNSRFLVCTQTKIHWRHHRWVAPWSCCTNIVIFALTYCYKLLIVICAISFCYLACVSISSLWAFTQAVLQYLYVSRSKGTCPAKLELHHAQLKNIKSQVSKWVFLMFHVQAWMNELRCRSSI